MAAVVMNTLRKMVTTCIRSRNSIPRMAVYSDFKGWQHLQFRSGAEFALNFGNFNLKITVPADHVVASTGECLNV
jgi:hypothetical protein